MKALGLHGRKTKQRARSSAFPHFPCSLYFQSTSEVFLRQVERKREGRRGAPENPAGPSHHKGLWISSSHTLLSNTPSPFSFSGGLRPKMESKKRLVCWSGLSLLCEDKPACAFAVFSLLFACQTRERACFLPPSTIWLLFPSK
jgi:hypothetical protein